jgi:hypothetical protein
MRNGCCDESIVPVLFSLASVFCRGPDSRDEVRPGSKKPCSFMKIDFDADVGRAHRGGNGAAGRPGATVKLKIVKTAFSA